MLGSLQGVVSVGTDQGHWIVPPVNAVWLPPHAEHWLTSSGAFRGWSVYVAKEACATLPNSVRVISHSGLLREAVARGHVERPPVNSSTGPYCGRHTGRDRLDAGRAVQLADAVGPPVTENSARAGG
ncbi:AraC family ligand binding domain-containing protein [Rhodovulum sulfidophilum]|uniref:AraC family ligand binding domain-containing protein n=1 Tax=Rhodovulum sulfidophilum TaxID=35806 RepID=UPI00351BB18D